VARHGLRGLLVVSELAFSLMLLIGAGLLIRSFVRLQNVPPGFAADHVLSMRVAATGPKYRQDKAVVAFYREIGDRISRLPGVTAQGQVSVLPLTGAVGWGGINVEGYTPPPGQELQVDLRSASTDYFRAMKIPLLKGRYFDDHDYQRRPAGGDYRRTVRATLLAARQSHRQASLVRSEEAHDDRRRGGDGQAVWSR
jgi:hypothetical protein